ncbi:hypothetical protein JTE90_014145 [Oedothorax gibbosus]|uniref:Uncharacterized protein n=1 Tax=Oedothorax gibbosus TaxID=931172 RepID=A0AAV6VL01_9ARAC|nr:hypothetical protein JTE90_014145 [Oedothorax gibbosus]
MPGNQSPAPALSAPPVPPKGSNLVRSKSLRLSSSRPKPEPGTSTLTRHGSIRVPRIQATTTKPPFTTFKKPALKPKPSFCSSRSSDNFENNVKSRSTMDLDKKSSFVTSKCVDGLVSNNGSDSHPMQSESPTSLHSDKSHSQDTSSWCAPDLVSHLRRLTEEHEKLQVEHARLRMQLLEIMSYCPVSNLRRDQQHLSQSDSHLASIPENSQDSSTPVEDQSQAQAQEILVQNYRKEVLQLQEENRKLQRKYWEQVLNSELVEDESCNGASQQIVDLIDKLDAKEKELLDATGKVQELDNHLAGTNLELQQCHDALQDQQRMLDETITQRDEMSKQLREYRRALSEAKETIDFMQIERATIAESFQETEQSLQLTKAEMVREQNKSNELMDRARKLYAKVKDKNLQVQLLRAELDRTQGSCRDMLLSQGAELTMLSMHMSQMSMTVHSMLTSAAEFAATELSLQKEMLEEVMADLDSEGEKSDSSPKENGLLKSDSLIPHSLESSQVNSLSNDKYSDTHKSLPDIFSCEPISPLHSSASSENERPPSLVQSMVRAFEQTAKSPDPKSLKPLPLKSSEQNSDSVKSSIENLSSINGDLSHISSPSKDSSPVVHSLFKPVGMATAFRPVRQQSLESDIPLLESVPFKEEKRNSLEAQLTQLDCLIKKVGKVIELTQEKFSDKLKSLSEEKGSIQEEVRSCKNKQYQLQTELNYNSFLVEKANGKTEELVAQLEKAKANFAEEKEALMQKNLSLTEEIKCLEAVNTEQANQIKEDINKMIETAVASPTSEFLSNAQSICDKLSLKQEIAKLKAVISQKEIVLQKLAQKFTRTTTSLEDNLKTAEKEIQVLDRVIKKVFTALEANSDLVEKHEALKNLHTLVSGNCTLSTINSNSDK